LPAIYTELVLNLARGHYSDFGPTLAREKLLERHGLLIGRETLRGLMRDAGLWHTRAARRKAVQQPRPRRQYFGELIQIDGSEHHWFEDRGSVLHGPDVWRSSAPQTIGSHAHSDQRKSKAAATGKTQRKVPDSSLPCPREAHIEITTSLCFDSECFSSSTVL
jgi:hypothetical protein